MIDPTRRGERSRSLALALLGFVLMTLAFHPVDQPWLAFVAFVPFLAFHQSAPRRGTVSAICLGYYVHFVGVLWWVGEIAVVGSFLIPLLGLPFAAISAWAARRAVHRWRMAPTLAHPLAFVTGETLRDQFLGLTWSSAGYTQWRWLELLQIVPHFRVHGVSLLVWGVNAALASTLLRLRRETLSWRSFAPVLGMIAVLAAVHAYGSHRMRTLDLRAGPLALGIQPNLSQDVRQHLSLSEVWKRHADILELPELANVDPDLLVFPETVGPPVVEPDRPLAAWIRVPLRRDPDSTWRQLFPSGRGQITVLGHSRRRPWTVPNPPDDDGDGYQEWNMATALADGERELGGYEKRRLVPFGEFVPWPRDWPLRGRLLRQIEEVGGYRPDLTPGTAPLVIDGGEGLDGARFGLTICFEIVYPQYFIESVRGGADFLVNISNDGWYHESEELDLVHVAARFRALECARSLLRVSNTGISTLVDPLGRYLSVAGTEQDRKGVAGFVLGEVPLCREATLVVRFRDWPLGALLLVGWLLGLAQGRFHFVRQSS